MSFKEFYIKENETEFDFEYFKSLSNYSKQNMYADDTFLSELISMSVNFGFAVNHFKKLTSLGEINNKIVVVDFGFTEAVYTTHYKGK
jgi:hypothetical protein